MGILDEDYPEKKDEGGLPKRSVKTSGLGALKGLSKYSKMTEKYKAKPADTQVPSGAVEGQTREDSSPTEKLTVEQQRGTFSVNPVQSGFKPGSSPIDVSPAEPGSNPVQVSSSDIQITQEHSGAKVIEPGLNQVQCMVIESVADSEPGLNQVQDNTVTAMNELRGIRNLLEKHEDAVSAVPTQVCEPGLNQVHKSSRPSVAIEPGSNPVQQSGSSDHGPSSLVTPSISPSVKGAIEPGSNRVQSTFHPPHLDFASEPGLNPVHSSNISPGPHSPKVEPSQQPLPPTTSSATAEQVGTYELPVSKIQGADLVERSKTEALHSSSSNLSQSWTPAQKPSVAEPNFPVQSEVSDPQFVDLPRGARESSSADVTSVQKPFKGDSSFQLNEVQTDFEPGSEPGSEAPTSSRTRFKAGPKVGSEPGSKLIQSGDNFEPTENVASLSGSQRTVLDFIFNLCVQEGANLSPRISMQTLSKATNISQDTAKTAVRRLREKFLIFKHSYKDGVSGWTRYQIGNTTYRELVNLLQYASKSVQTGFEVGSQVGSEVRSFGPNSSSSSVLNSKTTTTTALRENPFDALSQEWRSIDISILDDTPCRFSKADVVAIAQHDMLTPSQFQESLEHLRYDLSDPNRRDKVNRAMVFGVLKKSGSPWVSPGYLANLEREIRAQISAAERFKQAREEKVRADEDLEFQLWFNGLSKEEKQALANETPTKNIEGRMFEAYALNYFREKKELLTRPAPVVQEGSQSAEDVRRQIDESLAPKLSN